MVKLFLHCRLKNEILFDEKYVAKNWIRFLGKINDDESNDFESHRDRRLEQFRKYFYESKL